MPIEFPNPIYTCDHTGCDFTEITNRKGYPPEGWLRYERGALCPEHAVFLSGFLKEMETYREKRELAKTEATNLYREMLNNWDTENPKPINPLGRHNEY